MSNVLRDVLVATGDEILSLKNGARVNARRALSECMDLEILVQRYPVHFKTLLKIAQGEKPMGREVESARIRESIRFLKDCAYLHQDGSIKQLARDVLLSAYQMTPDGPAIVQPFLFETSKDKQIADDTARNMERSLKDWIYRIINDKDDQEPAR